MAGALSEPTARDTRGAHSGPRVEVEDAVLAGEDPRICQADEAVAEAEVQGLVLRQHREADRARTVLHDDR